ncbi:trypsin-like serine peptidase [Nocardioides stalactiti]|uniref:trypsin-like serine peptidase n=1 Tax=Nocardioides stalactiti TaxID=2755356 RepID=UPI00160297A5|nr:hypothetical protein [Nocardioides stalactiti]
MRTITTSTFRRFALAGAATALAAGLGTAPVPAAHADRTHSADSSSPAVGHRVSPAEQRRAANVDVKHLERVSKPLRISERDGTAPTNVEDETDGPTVTYRGTAGEAPAGVTSHRASGNEGALWPYANTANPNRQVGKLYFDIDPSAAVSWKHCTATAINSENKSTIATAGHCVYGTLSTGARGWYQNLTFIPAFENGRAPYGQWTARYISTTNNWFYNASFADDAAFVALNRDSAGVALVDRVGGHGIQFNGSTSGFKTSLGYPVTDSRWPGWTSSGNDLYYCQGDNSYYTSGPYAGTMGIYCRMTGGASGGPWLANTSSAWMGTVTTVNSYKPNAATLFAPYFGSAEQAVFQNVRAR